MTGRPVFNGLGKGIRGVFIAEHGWNYRVGVFAKHNEAQICTGMNISHTHGGAKWHALGEGVINHFWLWKGTDTCKYIFQTTLPIP